jgi:hypothetical protein
MEANTKKLQKPRIFSMKDAPSLFNALHPINNSSMKIFLALLTWFLTLQAQSSITPLVNDGTEISLLTFRIPTTEEKTLSSIEFSGSKHLKDIAKISLTHHRKAGNRLFAASQTITKNFTLKGSLVLPPGNHLFELIISLKPGVKLLHKISLDPDQVYLFRRSQSKTRPHFISSSTPRLPHP